MARQSDGWGTCITCGETLTPEDAERLGWSDRCDLCLRWSKLWDIINKRITYIKKQLETYEPGEARAHWTNKLVKYRLMQEAHRVVYNLKKEVWGETYPEEY